MSAKIYSEAALNILNRAREPIRGNRLHYGLRNLLVKDGLLAKSGFSCYVTTDEGLKVLKAQGTKEMIKV